MPSIKIKNFKYGLDSRRSMLESQPGTLLELTNAIINQGGEIEKSLAFVRTTAPADTFGAQPTAAGIVLFGSVASVTLPEISGVTFVYQRLQHPAVLDGVAYSAGSHAMTEITASECFAGKAWAVAKFADGNSYVYYDGVRVKDFTNGLVLAYMDTNAEIAAHLASIINDTTDYDGSVVTSTTVQIAGPVGVDFTINESETSAAGDIGTPAVQQEEIETRAGLSAVASFRVVAGSESAGVNKVTSIKVFSPAGASTELLSAAVDYNDDNDITAVALAQAINSYTGTSGYTASSEDETVTIYSATTASPMPNKYILQVTAAGNVCIGDCMFYFVQLASAGFTIKKITVNGHDIVVDQLYPDGGTDTFSELYSALATEINAGTTAGLAHGILAKASADYIQISKNVTRSDDLALPVSVVFGASNTGAVVFGPPPTAPTPLTVEVPANHFDFAVDTGNGKMIGVEPITALPAGGIAPYIYSWEPEAVGSDKGTGLGGTGTTTSSRTNWTMTPVTTSKQTTLFSLNIPVSGPSPNGTYTGRFICRVTGADGSVVISNQILVNITVISD